MTDVEDYPATGSYTLSPGEFENLDTPLAWSAGDPTTEPAPHHERHSWRTVAKIAVGIALAALVLIGAARMSARSSADDHNSWDGKGVTAHPLPTSETPEPPITPFRMPPPREAAHLTQDGEYVQLILRGNHWSALDEPVAEAVEFAHRVCLARSYGYSAAEIARYLSTQPQSRNTLAESMVIVNAATTAYCPGLG
jgi:hypothetical protein